MLGTCAPLAVPLGRHFGLLTAGPFNCIVGFRRRDFFDAGLLESAEMCYIILATSKKVGRLNSLLSWTS